MEIKIRQQIEPQHGYVLIKVVASPLNNRDLNQIGKNRLEMGIEGSGRVIKSGGGLTGWSILNKRVAFLMTQMSHQQQNNNNYYYGSYGEYVTVPAMNCVPLDSQVSFLEGCCSLVNPLTVLMIYEIIVQAKQKCIVLSGACGQLGRMINRYLNTKHIKVINIITNSQQCDILRQQEQCEFVLSTQSDNFESKLNTLCQLLDCKMGFDAIGDQVLSAILKNIKNPAIVYIHSQLSNSNTLDIQTLINSSITIKGFSLTSLLQNQSLFSLLSNVNKVRKNLKTIFKTQIHQIFTLDQYQDAFQTYQTNMTKGKCIFVFDQEAVQQENQKQNKL